MVQIDARSHDITALNRALRRAVADAPGETVEVLYPDARHLLAVGLLEPARVVVRGSAGYFCGGLSEHLDLEVTNNVGWGVADNLMSGRVVVRRNAGAIPGVAMRGGRLVVHGNLGSRAGTMMKAGTILCAGRANFMAGYMMMGGRMIICGDCARGVGQNMLAGEIFVGGALDGLGDDAVQRDPADEELAEIRALLAEEGIAAPAGFVKITSAGKAHHYGSYEPGEAEGARRPKRSEIMLPRGPMWTDRMIEDIMVKADLGRYRVRSFGAARFIPRLDDIGFRFETSRIAGLRDVLGRCNLAGELGGQFGGKPLRLALPVMVAPMSFGALSKNCKVALAKAASMAGIPTNTGEGGMLPEEREAADQLIYQCLSGRYGFSPHDLQRADAVEIYISQGAKPGLGGQLMGSKVTREIAEMRGLPQGIDIRSPSRHPDVLGADDLIIKIEEFREATDHRVPISLKLGAGRLGDDIKIALKDRVDFVEIDGMEGGTGASSAVVTDNVGIPTLAGIVQAIDGLAEIDAAGKLPIVLMGGIRDGVDAAKALALGASAVGMGTSLLVAMGCTGCMFCHTGRCGKGIATQSRQLVSRLGVDEAAAAVKHYFDRVALELAAITLACGKDDVRRLGREDLVALSPQAAEITGLPLAGHDSPGTSRIAEGASFL